MATREISEVAVSLAKGLQSYPRLGNKQGKEQQVPSRPQSAQKSDLRTPACIGKAQARPS